jgi:hypothetical protein
VAPDTKDWTWVLRRPCPECRFEAASIHHDEVSGLALEYACHVRDVYRLYDVRLGRMLAEDDPVFPNWDQNVTAIEERYELQQPARVAVELDDAALRLSAAFDGVSGDQWERAGRRGDGAAFTVDTFSRYLIHDPIHHIFDVDKGYRALAAR